MTILTLAQHDVSWLDVRHLGLLTVVIIGIWFTSARIGSLLRRVERRWLWVACVWMIVLVVCSLLIDPWLGLASLQVPLFVWKGYKSGPFV